MLPEVTELEYNSEQQETATIGKSYLFDFTTGDFVVKDGKLVSVSDKEALKIWITKLLKTERFKFMVYDRDDKDEYGITIEDLIVGYNYPPDFVESELKREITEGLLKHPIIESISNFEISKANPVLKVSFTVNLYDGTTVEVVNI